MTLRLDAELERVKKVIESGHAKCVVHRFRRAKHLAQYIEREPSRKDVIGFCVFGLCNICFGRREEKLTKERVVEYARTHLKDPE